MASTARSTCRWGVWCAPWSLTQPLEAEIVAGIAPRSLFLPAGVLGGTLTGDALPPQVNVSGFGTVSNSPQVRAETLQRVTLPTASDEVAAPSGAPCPEPIGMRVPPLPTRRLSGGRPALGRTPPQWTPVYCTSRIFSARAENMARTRASGIRAGLCPSSAAVASGWWPCYPWGLRFPRGPTIAPSRADTASTHAQMSTRTGSNQLFRYAPMQDVLKHQQKRESERRDAPSYRARQCMHAAERVGGISQGQRFGCSCSSRADPCSGGASLIVAPSDDCPTANSAPAACFGPASIVTALMLLWILLAQ